MSKVVLALALLGISLLFVLGLINPQHPIMWMAETSPAFTVIRAVLIVVLIALLVTHPPRNVYLRTVVGMICLGIASWALTATYRNELHLLDSLSLLEVCILSGIAVLEVDRDELLITGKSRRVKARNA